MNKQFRVFNADTGELKWETTMPGYISMSTITYAVNGKQYIVVMTGDNLKTLAIDAVTGILAQQWLHWTYNIFPAIGLIANCLNILFMHKKGRSNRPS